MTEPQLFWDWGTAYDLFVSLAVLHEPGDFGVRGAWAAGVRARLPAAEREILEESQILVHIPFGWIYALPEPKDGAAVLWTLGQIAPAERLSALSLGHAPCDLADLLRNVAARESWDDGDLEAVRAVFVSEMEKKAPSTEKLTKILNWWSRTEEFGERYLAALQAYHEVFFAEEEKRIRPALQEAVARGQEMAGRLLLLDLLEELSQGVRFAKPPESPELVLTPSYWCTPLMFFGMVSEERAIRLFGARPPDASLVPGEVVPDSLLRALKALSDPTRLRILHYLAEEPLTPAELARRLRLRAPTVTHHLKTLRLAGLVQFSLGEDKEDRRYAPRTEAIGATCDSLKGFLKQS
jgi:DNA-binding transcriptional ArsR family regulator